MADDIRTMTAELARDPESLVFVRLGEVLRLKGQLDAAAKIALSGVETHGHLPDAHDLYARVLSDAGDFDGAEREWNAALSLDARHGGAHKGLGFLHYRKSDIDGALDHLELALAADPTDKSVVQALTMVREAVEGVPAEVADALVQSDTVEGATPRADGATLFAGLEGASHGLLLADVRGRVLGGELRDDSQAPVSDEVAAHLGGVSQEVDRTTRLLELGQWEWMVAEGANGNVFLTQPTAGSLLLLTRDRGVPSGRMAILAEKATGMARAWLETQGL